MRHERSGQGEERILFSFGGAQGALGRGIIPHPTLNLILTTDISNASIQAYTLCGDYVTTHTLQIHGFCPWGLACSEQTVYLSDVRGNRVLSLNDFAVVVVSELKHLSASRLKSPKGLACDRESNVYVADKGNHRICVFDYELNLSGLFRHQLLYLPRDLAVVEDQLLALTENIPFILVFSLSGELLRTIDQLKQQVICPWFFHVDASWNIFISDYDSFAFKQFNREGEMCEQLIAFNAKHSLKRISVFGICVTADKQVCVAISDRARPFLLLSSYS